jgi:hypothetical protein
MNYRLTIYPALECGNKNMEMLFETADQMVAASKCAANLLLFLQDKIHVMKDYSNVFIMEVRDSDGVWFEYDDDWEVEDI